MGCLSQGQHRRSVWRWMGLCFAAGVLFFGVAGISSAADGISVYYVAPNGNGGGVSPCYATIQAAVNAADEPGDLIKVAAGTYLACNNEGGTSQCVRLIKTVTLRGGYTTSNWTVSNPAANPTVIDARGRGRCIFIQGSGIAPTVEGFEIRGGTANSAPVGKGGGVFVLESAATLRRNRITSNTATASSGAEGGGIYMENSNGVVEDNLIDLNRTNNAGGGCRVYRGAPRLDRNRFIQNSAYWGGGCSVDIANNTTFRNCVFAKNTAQYGGGLGVYDCKVQAWHCTFSENRAPTGGGLLQWAQDLNFAATNMIFANHPEVAIRVIRGSVTLNGVLWFNNATNTQGDVTVSHERTGDPAFVAPASNDYHIGAGSAALDAGVALVDGVILPVEDDVDRQLRPMRFGYDLGADEFPGVGLRLTKNPAQQILNRDYPCTYTIAVANLSTGTATGVVLTDTLDVWQRPKSVQATHGSVSTTTPTWGGGVIWNLGTMTPTAAATMTLVVDIATTTPAGQQILNTAQLVAAETTRMVPAANVVQTVRARVNNNPTEYLSIQAAVDAARAGDTVRVTGSGFGVLQRGGYRQQVYVNKNLTIQGGWNRTFTVRNPALYPTVVDAIGRGRCFYIAPRVTATLEGLQLRNGDAEDLGGYTTAEVCDGGGCIYGSTVTLTVRDCTIDAGSAEYGGGLYLYNSTLSLRRSTLTNNRASEDGGGAYFWLGNITLAQNTFTTNSCYDLGGGFCMRKCTAEITSNTIRGNTNDDGYGGGFSINNSTSTLRGNLITRNSSFSDGGGGHAEESNMRLERNTITYNNVTDEGDGGGLLLNDSIAELHYNTISNNWVSDRYYSGGGVSVDECDTTFTYNTIASNTAGESGGLYFWRGNHYLLGNVIQDNVAQYYGGGGAGFNEGTVVITSNTIQRNRAPGGDAGGLYCGCDDATLTSNTIRDNTADWDGGGILVAGFARMARNRIHSNTASDGGGVYLYNADAQSEDNIIIDNHANGQGGGVLSDRSTLTSQRDRITSNTATDHGGGVNAWDSTATLINTVVARNRAAQGGSGLYGSQSARYRLLHCTIADNILGQGYGMHLDTQTNSLDATNTIVCGHAIGARAETGSTITLNGVLWNTNTTNTVGAVTVRNARTGNPAFVNAAAGNYHIGAGSAARDTGVLSTVVNDMDGQFRPMGRRHDLGADEYPDVGLALTKTPSDSVVDAGQITTYTIVVRNAGFGTATNVVVRDTLGSGQTAVRWRTTSGTVSAGPPAPGPWTIGSLAPGAGATMWLGVQVSSALPAGSRVTNFVRATSNQTTNTALVSNLVQTVRARINENPQNYYSVQAAVDAARPGDTVKVTGTGLGVFQRGGTVQHVLVNKTLTIQGGYNSTFTARDPVLYPTVLNAVGRGCVIRITGNINPVLDGLRITGGMAPVGGGIYGDSTGASVQNSWIYNNTAEQDGGGMYFTGTALRLAGNQVTSNTANNHGGGLMALACVTTLTANVFDGNTGGGRGGGLRLESSTSTLAQNTISRNTAGTAGGLSLARGAAVLSENRLTTNTARRMGTGGGFHGDYTSATLIANWIAGNTVTDTGGGGGYTDRGSFAYYRNTFYRNRALWTTNPTWGGALYSYGTTTTLVNNMIVENSARTHGGGILLKAATWRTGITRGIHNTFARNTAFNSVLIDTSVTLTNTIFSSATEAVKVGFYNDPNVRLLLNTTLWHDTPTTAIGPSSITAVNNLYGNPAFVNIRAGNYHITTASAALDRAVPAGVGVDFDGQARPFGAGYDIGADEYSTAPTFPPAPVMLAEPAYTSGTTNRVAWNASAGATAYYLEWSRNAAFAPVAGNSGWITGLNHTATGLVNGGRYYFHVKARNAGGEGPWSNVVHSLQDSAAPAAPGRPTDAGAFTSSTAVRFNWTAATDPGTTPSGIASYDLQVGTTAGGSNIFNGNVGNVLTRTVTGANGQTLYARVRARDRAGNVGLWSANSDGITVDTVKPRLTAASARDLYSVIVSFNEPVVNADKVGNYWLSGGLRVQAAQTRSTTQSLVQTSTQTLGQIYTITVGGTLRDRAGNAIDPAYSSRNFSGGAKTNAHGWQLYR